MTPGQGMLRSLIVENPVVRREARVRFWRGWPQDRKLAAVVGAAGGLALLAFLSRALGGAMPVEDRQALLIAYGALMALLAAVVGGRSVAGEREVRTWEQLLITRLRPVHLVAGKIIGVLWQIGLLALVAAPALWILATYVSLPSRGSVWGAVIPSYTALLFYPPGLGRTQLMGVSAPEGLGMGLLWLFATTLLWIVQGATIGVFASLRYRSTVTSAVVALLMLLIAAGVNGAIMSGALAWADAGAFVRHRPLGMATEPLVVITTLIALWGWPLITIAILLGLATYEFREFDVWLQAPQAAARR
jgi:hypothetical protein